MNIVCCNSGSCCIFLSLASGHEPLRCSQCCQFTIMRENFSAYDYYVLVCALKTRQILANAYTACICTVANKFLYSSLRTPMQGQWMYYRCIQPLLRGVATRWERQVQSTVRPTGRLFLVPAVLPIFTLLLSSSSVSFSYFILAVAMLKCLKKHSCMSSTFPIAKLYPNEANTEKISSIFKTHVGVFSSCPVFGTPKVCKGFPGVFREHRPWVCKK